MSELNSSEYYRGREQKERTLAEAATNPTIAAIHHDFAVRYSKLSQEAAREAPAMLRLVHT